MHENTKHYDIAVHFDKGKSGIWVNKDNLDVCSSILYYWWCGYDYIKNEARVFEPKREWGEGGVKEKKLLTADKSVEVSKHVNVVLGSNSATRTPNVVNACLETFLTIFEAHGTHSPASVNEENINDVDTKGMSSYARALIEVRVDVELKDDIVVPMPKLVGEGFYTCTVH
ncbi:hypothetical protein Tco_0308016 [Tanacetum coccineum]